MTGVPAFGSSEVNVRQLKQTVKMQHKLLYKLFKPLAGNRGNLELTTLSIPNRDEDHNNPTVKDLYCKNDSWVAGPDPTLRVWLSASLILELDKPIVDLVMQFQLVSSWQLFVEFVSA